MIYLSKSMDLSQSSKSTRDPLTDVLDVLGARVTRQTRMEAAGRWALAFPAIDRLKFMAMIRGTGWILLPGQAPQSLTEGDVCVLGRTAYTIASHPEEATIDGQSVYAAGCDVARLGGDDTIAIGGTVLSRRLLPITCSTCCRSAWSFLEPRLHPVQSRSYSTY